MSVESHQFTGATIDGRVVPLSGTLLIVTYPTGRYEWSARGMIEGTNLVRQLSSSNAVAIEVESGGQTFSGQAFVLVGAAIGGSRARTVVEV
jgi:hypothetical protein